MINPVLRFKEWIEYKQALKNMEKTIKLQKEIPADEDGNISGDNKKLFDYYMLSFALSSMVAMNYQVKYLK